MPYLPYLHGSYEYEVICVAGMFVVVAGCPEAVGRSEAYQGRHPLATGDPWIGAVDWMLLRLLGGGFKCFFSTPIPWEMILVDC